ncbi:hypothetical protein P170DRAFT_437731 [Aspergillus steynii IBT 23096]|uniref:Uncharacterized protein n=1 Tax=Aspergillus steynii IBT 23096 TaxID=1392250 RepID=A0A2I2G598_9EURO|nr:uncharacterized protein P170DRAFT_437731 [Aspergillus steynii IBT 23096]PLB48023.1 hypothetical protein P170DRAFT_437731 [Aspergillus steynii IBT 23096]
MANYSLSRPFIPPGSGWILLGPAKGRRHFALLHSPEPITTARSRMLGPVQLRVQTA